MSIPASRVVTINPQVLSAGAAALALNTLFLTENLQMPTGSVFNFGSPAAVAAFFGPASAEAALAPIYFAGYQNSTVKPTGMLFASYNLAARAGWLQGGSLAGMTLTQLQALTGVLTISLDGTPETSSTINLSGATSFSNAATLIAAGFGTAPVVAWNPVNSTFTFTSNTTGVNSSLSFATGSLSEGLKLAADDGGILSAGAIADTPNSAMTNAVAVSQNWCPMVTMFEPAIADKEKFAVWFNSQNNRYVWLAWDTDAQAIVPNTTEAFGVVAKELAYNGVCCISGSAADIASGIAAGTIPAGTTLASALLNTAAFVGGAIASIDFSATNGRITLAFRTQSGLIPTCTSDTASQTLLANGYSYFGTYATAAQNFNFFYNGQLPGEFDWLDSLVNEVWMNANFQQALLTGLTNKGAINYTPSGYSFTRQLLADPINAGVNFGSIVSGTTLSDAETAEINEAAGVDAATQVENNGYYLQVKDPGAQARAARQTPIINFWYSDGGAVQQFTMASIAVQ